MKYQTRPFTLGRAFMLGAVLVVLNAAGQGTLQDPRFVYQGRLTEGSTPATGSYQMQFRLRDGPSDTSAVLANMPPQAVSVVDSLFNVSVDFPVALFDGRDRWLEISVASPAMPATFTVLLPRQKITPTPYALYAAKAAMLTEKAPQTDLSNRKDSAHCRLFR